MSAFTFPAFVYQFMRNKGVSPKALFGNFVSAFDNFVAGNTGTRLTDAQTQQNEFNAIEAQKQRDFEEKMSNTSYQRGVSDMVDAGVNPALAMSNGGASTPSGSAATSGSVQPTSSFSDMMQMAMLPAQLKMMKESLRGQSLENDLKEIDLQFLSKEKTTALALTSAQIDSLRSSLENDKVQRALNMSNISLNEANEALTIQNAIATVIDNETRDALNNAMLSYRAAETAYTEQKTAESKRQLDVMTAQINELYQRAILESAQAGLFSAEEQNVLRQTGLLYYDEKKKEFEVNYQKADRVWRNVLGTVSAIGSVVGGVGSLMVGKGVLNRVGSVVAPSQPSNLYLPRSTSAFENNYGIPR